MELLLARHLWGVDLSPGWDVLGRHWRATGYRALEVSPRHVADPAALRAFLRESGFAWIPQVYSNRFVPGGTVEQHLGSLREQIEECLDDRPLFFNSHSGSDGWNLSASCRFFTAALDLEKEYGVPISHETHRSRCFFSPWATRDILREVPGLRLTCDFSHWVCVAERLLPDCGDILQLAADHAHHVHARVGFEEGPQVPDPFHPSAAAALAAHESWWDRVWESQRRRGMTRTTLTPEFGPPPYLHTDPATGRPLADLAAVCDAMARRQRDRFARHA